MGFPYLAPLAPWVVDIMKQREEYPEMSTFKSPWAIITSGALVSKVTAETDVIKRRDQIKGLINGTLPAGETYNGCIISNNINDNELSYSTQKTAIGKDFNGKVITVEGETGRKVSTPIIESIEIDTDGANNTLKTARVSVRCFTLKQFEMFELFFLKPGMNVLVEFGDSTLLKNNLFPFEKSKVSQSIQNKKKFARFKDGSANDEFKPFTRIEDALVPKNGKYSEFCENFSKYYRSDTEAIGKYMERVEQSLGSYDLVAGKVLDYSFSIADDGTYEVSFEVSQGNQISLAIPHNPKTSTTTKTKTGSDNENFKPYDQIREIMTADLNLGDGVSFEKLLNLPHPEGKDGKWENDWFNFIKINEQQKDTVATDEAYVSLRFILDILMNYSVGDGANVDKSFFKLELPKFIGPDGKEKYFLSVTSNIDIISSNADIIFPTRELPKFIATSDSENKIGIATDKRVTGLINGYDFHTDEELEIPLSPKKEKIKATGNEKVGNALNIFISYKKVVKIWNSTVTRVDFLENILSICNENSYGLFLLTFGVSEQNGQPSIIDMKGSPTNGTIDNNTDIYRFKPNTIKSNVLNFSFNFEMSNLVAGRQIFNSGKFIAEAKDNKEPKDVNTGKLPLPPKAYKLIDNSTMGNADGWYSINNVELITITKKYETAQSLKGVEITTTDKKSETATNEADNINEVISQKCINFKLTKSAKDLTPLIFKDADVITKNIYNRQQIDKEKKPTLSPIDITITVDGFSGFVPGQYFRIDGVPEIYNQIGVFQITNTKHSVSPEGWKTTIEASHRITPKK